MQIVLFALPTAKKQSSFSPLFLQAFWLAAFGNKIKKNVNEIKAFIARVIPS